MLEQLIESKSDGQKTARGGFLLTTTVLVLSLFASGILWSLFARDLGGTENLELSMLVAPVKLTEDEPAPDPPKQNKPEQSQKSENSLPVRNDNIARIDESQPTPDKILTTQSNQKARPEGAFRIDKDAPETEGNNLSARNTGDSQSGSGISNPSNPKEEKPEAEDLPPDIKKKVEEPKVEKQPQKIMQSLGVINGRAKSLPVPAYPLPAKAVGATGEVNVQVTIDEQGNVISAKAVSGHVLLRQAAENAARGAKFTPTLLSKQPVKVTGVIIYRFAPR